VAATLEDNPQLDTPQFLTPDWPLAAIRGPIVLDRVETVATSLHDRLSPVRTGSMFKRPTISRRHFTLGAAALAAAPVVSQSSITYAQPATPTNHRGDAPLEDFNTLVHWLSTQAQELQVPGAAVGVAAGDERFTHAFGVTETGTEDSFTTSTQFGIASLTKIFTATALSSLVQDGALSLDDPVTMYLSDFRLADPDATAAVTVSHLVSHAGGWADILEPVPGQDSLAWYASHMPEPSSAMAIPASCSPGPSSKRSPALPTRASPRSRFSSRSA
jgi:CubicO group peptidase (beta-lactamase class C family)